MIALHNLPTPLVTARGSIMKAREEKSNDFVLDYE
jgi:hypothetical protein